MEFRTWCVDMAIAYAGGIVLGAPLGLVALWTTGNDAALGSVILLAMIGLLFGRRAWRHREPPDRTGGLDTDSKGPGAPDPG